MESSLLKPPRPDIPLTVAALIKRETGKTVVSDTLLESLELDSLEFLDLMMALGVPHSALPGIETVADVEAYLESV